MPARKIFRPTWLVVTLAALVAAAVGIWFRLHPRAHVLQLADGTAVYFRSGTKVGPLPGYPQPRAMRVDGDLFLQVPAGPQPLVVRSRLLTLTITGEAALRITAFSAQTGEQAEVLRGHVVARKAYPSNYLEPDTLVGGDMVMINRTIDLMEKEKCDPADVARWRDELVRAARP